MQQEMIAQSQSSIQDTSTVLMKREFSGSWVFDNNKITYRRLLKQDETGSTWRRYGASFSGIGSFIPAKPSAFSNTNQSFSNQLSAAINIGKEKRRQLGEINSRLEWITGYDYFGFLSDNRKYQRRDGLINNVLVPIQSNEVSQLIGVGIKPFLGFRYQINKYFSISTESSISASINAQFRKTHDENSLGPINTRLWQYGYRINTVPIDAIWLTFSF
jgi:hypothetical protein